MVSIPNSYLHLLGDSTTQECVLERTGDFAGLQRFRWNVCLEGSKPLSAGPVDLAGLLQTEAILRENDQREVAIKERIRLIRNASGNNEDKAPLIEDLKMEIRKLRKEYWLLQRRWWEVRSSFPECPLSRGVDLWRSHPEWFLHRWLRDDCSGRGGCCGRDCGCCAKRSNRPGRNLAIGHCTIECHCCEQARGFRIDAKHKLQIQKALYFDQDYRKNSVYANRMIQIATLGLTIGNFDNPINLISSNIDCVTMPPEYSPPLCTSHTKGKVEKALGFDRKTLINDFLIRYDVSNSSARCSISNHVYVITVRCLLLFGFVALMAWFCKYSSYLCCCYLLWLLVCIFVLRDTVHDSGTTCEIVPRRRGV